MMGKTYTAANGQVVTDEFEDVVFVVDEQDAMTHKSVRNFCEDNKLPVRNPSSPSVRLVWIVYN